ncbi:MAG: hypothetical protein ABJA49_11125 [Betaproteobacteria bacterium]
MQSTGLKAEIAGCAARLVVEDGLEYGPAKRQALHMLGLPARTALPDNEEIEDAVFEHIAVFCADTQREELAALRLLAMRWMEQMADFRPYLTSAVWRGNATRRSDVLIDLFCDDCKSAELALIDRRVHYQAHTVGGMRGETVEALTVMDVCPGVADRVAVQLRVYDHDQLRGALRADARGRAPRGNLAALRLRMEGGGS